MEELISIIVPVYNVEEYIEKCVESIINQTYKNIEIILVDDGATDNSGKICDELGKRDSRIKIIHKANGGLSDARNAGLKIAKGEYIGFVDSDDYIAKDMFETLYNLNKKYNSEISIVSFYEIYKGKVIGVRDSKNLEELTKIEAIRELLIDTNIQSYAWNKLFKKELFDGLEFPTNKNFEDIATTLLLFEKANKVVLLEDPKYYYVRRDNSIVGVRNYKTYKDYLDVILDKYNYLDGKYEELDLYNAYNYIINMIWVYTIIVAFDLEEVYKEFEKQYDLFEKLINKYENEITDKLDNYNKSVLYMMLLNKEYSKPAVKQLYKTYKEKRNEGDFGVQI
ncbi:MAG: glycosyltransferase family 2 protein [Clostridia bacterium]|nr:glycosyltransferase family 2 protein [Clostridia bacterium]